MKAQVIERFGGPEALRGAELPRPNPGPGEVLVRVKATSVNPVDTKIRSGEGAEIAPAFPAVLHGDVAGIVEEVGPGVTRFRLGDEVFGCAGGVKGLGGALAELMVADARLLAMKPPSLDFRAAAALPLVSLTAWEALVDRARVQPGHSVLVQAGVGGVGHVGVQLARALGARVVATVSGEEKARLARELGADATIDYRREKVADAVAALTQGRGFDVVFDTVGGPTLDRSFEAAAVGGTVVSILTQSTHDLSPLHGKGLSFHVVFMLLPMLLGPGREHQGEILERVARLMEAGRLRPLLDPHRFSLERASEAHAWLESGRAVGKVVIDV